MNERMTSEDLYTLRALLAKLKDQSDTPAWAHTPINTATALTSVMLDQRRAVISAGLDVVVTA